MSWPYATVRDVEAANRARKLGQGANPTPADAAALIEMVAGEIDSVLLNKGYQLPVPDSAVSALALLRKINVEGAIVMIEEGSPSHPDLDKWKAAYKGSLDRLREAADSLGIPFSTARAEPRGPGVTIAPPSIDPCNTGPFFSRDMRF